MVRDKIKRLLKSFGFRCAITAARNMRNQYYQFLEAGGQLVFFILRGLRIIPEIVPYNSNRIYKILIIRTDRIGDLVLSTPSFTALKNKFPKAYISLVVNNYTKELVVNNPMIDKVITCDSETSLFDKLRFILDLRRMHFDLILVLHSTFWSCAISFLSGALFRIGYKERGCGFLLTTPIPPKKGDEIVHEVEKTLDIVRVIGANIEAKELYIGVTEQGERYAETFFREMGISSRDKIVAIHPGARQEYIRWQKEGFAEIANNLIEEYHFKILLVGDDSEEHLVEDILRLIKNKKKVIPTGNTTLTQLVSLLKRCNLFIGNSTGPMHMAAALNIPVVAIFGCINPLDNYRRWGPWGNGHIVVSKDLNCPDCHPSDCKTFDCMMLITPKEVLAAASKQMRDK